MTSCGPNLLPYQRTPKQVARAMRYSGLGVRSVGPVGDFLEGNKKTRLCKAVWCFLQDAPDTLSPEQWKKTWLFRSYRGLWLYYVPNYIGILISQYKDTYKPTNFFFGGGSLSNFAPHNSWRIPTFMFKMLLVVLRIDSLPKINACFLLGGDWYQSCAKIPLKQKFSMTRMLEEQVLQAVANAQESLQPAKLTAVVCWNLSTNLANGIRLDPCSTNVVECCWLKDT